MTSTTKTLRDYQARLITDVCRAAEDVLVEQPTGSGKTVQIVTLVAMHLGQRFTHVVISAPQEQIEQGFTVRDYNVIAFPASRGVAVPSLQASNHPRTGLIRGARGSGLGSVRQIAAYLRQPGKLDYALACTHAALNQLTPEQLPDNLSGKALFIDEAHHASADGLSQLVALWRERGGRLFFFTATPYRGDNRPVKLEHMKSFRRSLAEHMDEGFAPRHLDSEIVALGQPGDAITGGQFQGMEALPESYEAPTVAAICRRWLEDDKPKAIIRVPPMRDGKSREMVSQLIQVLSSQGARVLDATGTGVADKLRFLSALEAEKSRSYATSAFDVMVGIQRVLEGTDWPVCSAVYCVGMPGSLNTVVQFLGRAMRLKGTDYPAAQRDRARLVFFVPCGGGAALAELSLDHSRHALLTCCFLADHEVGQEWIVLREVRRGIEAALGTRTQNPAAADAENEADEPLDPAVRAEVELVMAAAREQLVGTGGAATVGEVVQLAAKSRPDLPAAALQRVAAEILAAQPTGDGAAVRKAIQQEVARRLRIDPLVKQAMAAAFAFVLEEFRDVTLNESVVLESVGRQVHGVTGGQMREFAQRLRDAAPRPLTEEQILVWADQHYGHTQEWPRCTSGELVGCPDEKWELIDAALRTGLRGLPGGSSLPQLLEEKRGVRNRTRPPELTVELILGWADAHRGRTGQWPEVLSGTIEEAPEETWRAIHMALTTGGRGLPGASSLRQLLAEHRGVRNPKDLPPLTEEQILAWADSYHEQTGKWPVVKAGEVQDAHGENWALIDNTLARGGRTLPGNSSLAKLLAEERGVRNSKDLPPLTTLQILIWADAYFARTGQWPTLNSGTIYEPTGETWKTVNRALLQGLRGLPGSSSLAQLLADERGVRNPTDPPPLSLDQILEWADAHFQRTGGWPNGAMGSILDAPSESWSGINAALATGGRSLVGRSSLAQLLNEQRGVRNRKGLPTLTVAQILAWADAYHERTGEWPNGKTGTIPEQPGETWPAINSALVRGSRGLSISCSLADLLAEHRGVRNVRNPPKLTENQILVWANAYKERTGQWPKKLSGLIEENPSEKWANIDAALIKGLRGLPGESSLARLIQEHQSITNQE